MDNPISPVAFAPAMQPASSPYAGAATQPQSNVLHQLPPVLDMVNLHTSQPYLKLEAATQRDLLLNRLLHPRLTPRLEATLASPQAAAIQKKTGETAQAQKAMFFDLYGKLGGDGRQNLINLLTHEISPGVPVLLDTSTDETHTLLHALYAMATTPRAEGFDNKSVTENMLRILVRPYDITQQFDPLTETSTRDILAAANGIDRFGSRGSLPLSPQLTEATLKSSYSALCVASSVMHEMAENQPAKLARQINQATSPLQGFFEKAQWEDISPDAPEEAAEILRLLNITFYPSGPREVTVLAKVPHLGYLRAINDGLVPGGRSEVEAVYQATFSNTATRGAYNAATDERSDMYKTAVMAIQQVSSLTEGQKNALYKLFDAGLPPAQLQLKLVQTLNQLPNLVPQDKARIIDSLSIQSKGITPLENAVVASIFRGSGAIVPVTYQFIETKPTDDPTNLYLYGYTSSFEQMERDLLEELAKGKKVMIGFLQPDSDGYVGGGHEISLTGYKIDPLTGKRYFIAADSDDRKARPVLMPIDDLVPKIHHAYFDAQRARQIHKRIEDQGNMIFIPDESDKLRYDPVSTATLPSVAPSAPFPGTSLEPAERLPYMPNPPAEIAGQPDSGLPPLPPELVAKLQLLAQQQRYAQHQAA